MNPRVYNVHKFCAVPLCGNTSKKHPDKLFIYVPNDKTVRNKWFSLARRDPKSFSLNTSIYFCEDHFDLPRDMENYMQYHVMGSVSQIRMKPGCMPTKFECQPDRKKRTRNSTERPYINKKQRKELIEECLRDLGERNNSSKHFELVCVKEEPESNESADVIKEKLADVIKEEGGEGDEAAEEASGSAGASGSEAAMSAALYADHVVKDELLLGPEVPHRPHITSLHVCVKQEPESNESADVIKEELADVIKEEGGEGDESAEEASDSAGARGSEAAMLAALYADHVVKVELVLDPEVPHRSHITSLHDPDIVIHHSTNDQMSRKGSATELLPPEGHQCHQPQCLVPDNILESNPCQNTGLEYEIAEPEAESSVPTSNEAAQATEVPVEPELLMALGDSTDDIPEFGKPIHENLASLWLPLLKKGLLKENKEKLMKQHLIPENCKLLQAPTLNAEISAAVSEIVRGRDKKLTRFQQQLGAGITALNKGMEILLNSDQKAQALTYLSDSCRILTDLHCASTRDRIKLITPSLETNILHVIQDSERDDTLFGNALSEKIRACKAIQRQGQQIKKTVSYQATSSGFRQTAPNRFTPPGNCRGPPRYYTSRDGRGSQTRMAAPRRPYDYNTTPSTSTAKSVLQPKPRAPTQQ